MNAVVASIFVQLLQLLLFASVIIELKVKSLTLCSYAAQ